MVYVDDVRREIVDALGGIADRYGLEILELVVDHGEMGLTVFARIKLPKHIKTPHLGVKPLGFRDVRRVPVKIPISFEGGGER